MKNTLKEKSHLVDEGKERRLKNQKWTFNNPLPFTNSIINTLCSGVIISDEWVLTHAD